MEIQKFDKSKYDQEYIKTHYKTYTIRVKSDLQLYIESYCEKYGKTVNGLFVEAVKDYTGYMGND